ncbi:MAG: hypothetical protein Q8O33_10010 [Pseudomonadota bacterium]|nr:hypothetical protein [Pseudomonadota bacterium]
MGCLLTLAYAIAALLLLVVLFTLLYAAFGLLGVVVAGVILLLFSAMVPTPGQTVDARPNRPNKGWLAPLVIGLILGGWLSDDDGDS